MITFGLTGGIACGKSTVSSTLRKLGVPMVDADQVARDVVVPGSTGLGIIIDAFGRDHLQEDGTLNRASLAKLVFADDMAMDRLNKIMAPLINEASSGQIRRAHSKGHRVVGYDAALIIEMGNASKYYPLIVVSCPQETQIERMMRRNGVSRDDAMARLRHQTTTKEKIKLAQYVIDTSGTVEDSIKQTKNVLHLMRKTMGRYCWDCGREYHPNDKAIMCEVCGFDNQIGETKC